MIVDKEALADNEGRHLEHKPGDDCFFCGKPLTLPWVMWSGIGSQIALHPPCVIELNIRMMRDVHWLTNLLKLEVKLISPHS